MRPETVDYESGIMLGEMPLSSLILEPETGQKVPSTTPITVRGIAYVGGNRTVERVEVSLDQGNTWVVARMGPRQPFAWRRWEAVVGPLPAGALTISCRAMDSSAQTQPESVASVWNFKGYMNNAIHQIQIQSVPNLGANL